MTIFIIPYTSAILQWLSISAASPIPIGFDADGIFLSNFIGYEKLSVYILLFAVIMNKSVINTVLKKAMILYRLSSKQILQSSKTCFTAVKSLSSDKNNSDQTVEYYNRFENDFDDNEILINKNQKLSSSKSNPQNINILEQLERMDIVVRTIKRISSTLDIDELFSRITGSLTKISGFHWAAVVFLDDIEPWESKWKLPGIASMEKHLNETIGKTAPVYYRVKKLQLSSSLRSYFHKRNINAVAVSPLGGGIKARGFLLAGSSNPDGFKSNDDLMLKNILQALDIAVENAVVYNNLKKAYVSLAETRERLIRDEKFKALGEVAAGIAHDFKNILSAIIGRAQMLHKIKEKNKIIPDDVLTKGLDIIEKSAVDGVEILSRINESTNNKTKSITNINLREIINDTIEMTRPKWENQEISKSIVIQTDFKTEPVIKANRYEMIRVFSNFLLNAVEAIETDGVIEIKVEIVSDKAVINISDSGQGMDKQTIGMIFNPYFTTKGQLGTGLGLSIVYTIIHRYNGKINVNSVPGEGTTFTITIPCEQGTRKRDKISILIVEDDTNLRDVLYDIITEISHEVYLAGNYAEANEILTEHPIDLVITDLGLPDKDGWKVVDKANYYSPDSLIIPMTGWQKEIDKKELASRGIMDVLQKPFKIEQVRNLIQEAIARKKDALRV